MDALRQQQLGHIPHPDPPNLLPSLAELGRLAEERQRSAAERQSGPAAVIGDAVTRFGEVDAARGALGRWVVCSFCLLATIDDALDPSCEFELTPTSLEYP